MTRTTSSSSGRRLIRPSPESTPDPEGSDGTSNSPVHLGPPSPLFSPPTDEDDGEASRGSNVSTDTHRDTGRTFRTNRNAYAVMLSLVCRKFCQNQNLTSYLLSTKNAWLIEANPGDSFWGAGLGVREIEDRVRRNGVNGLTFPGGNHLGKILMRVRSFLAGEGGMPRCLALGDSIFKGLDFLDASVLVWPGANLEIITLLADLAYIPGAFSQIVVHAGTNDLADLASGGVGPGTCLSPDWSNPTIYNTYPNVPFYLPAKQLLFISTYWASKNYNF